MKKITDTANGLFAGAGGPKPPPALSSAVLGMRTGGKVGCSPSMLSQQGSMQALDSLLAPCWQPSRCQLDVSLDASAIADTGSLLTEISHRPSRAGVWRRRPAGDPAQWNL